MAKLKTQAETEAQENKFQTLLYTDASVGIKTDHTGEAAIGYIWYRRKKEAVQKISECIALIGNNHSSYSAEAVAITEALINIPEEVKDSEIALFTDSLSNLITIKAGVAHEKEQQDLSKVMMH